jgi:hypothetical protein
MSLKVSRNSAPQAPVGQYAALCVDVYDAGWWPNMEKTSHVQKCKVVFYLGKDEETGRDLYIDLFETLSLGKKANLTKHLVSWRGKEFTEEELKGFDLELCVGRPALIQVASKPKADGSARSIVGAIMALPKGMTPPDVPKDFKRDRDRDEQFASKNPRPAAKTSTLAEAAKAHDEDDDLPF